MDTVARTVRLASGRALDCDYIVYAVGSTGAVPSVPAGAEFAGPSRSWSPAQRPRARLEELPLEAPVTVVGGGSTGVETAAELAERRRTVTLVCGRTLAPYLSAGGRRYVATWLTHQGVALLEGGTVTEVRPDAVVLADGSAGGVVRPSALTSWTAGFGLPELAAASGLRTDALGRLLTDETLTSIDDDRIVAAAATPPGAGPASPGPWACPRAAGVPNSRPPLHGWSPPREHRRARRAIHRVAAAAVHDRVRDPWLGDRIRRRAAGQLPAVGQGGSRGGAGHQVVSGAAGDPSGAQRPACEHAPSEEYIGSWLPEPLGRQLVRARPGRRCATAAPPASRAPLSR